MKLSKKVWLIVGIGIIVVLIIVVFMVHFRQVREQQDLEDRLDAATALSITLAADKKDLEDQLSQAQSLLDTSQVQFPQAVESIEYGEYIFEIAEKCNLTLASLTFPMPSGATQGSVTYRVVPLSLPVSGTVENIFEFIDIINTDERFASTRVNSVNLNVAGGSATIDVDILGYRR